jgi:hypothetical protein
MNCLPKPDRFIVTLASPEALIRLTIYALVVPRIWLLVKVSNRSIGKFSPLHKSRAALPHQESQNESCNDSRPLPQHALGWSRVSQVRGRNRRQVRTSLPNS